MAQAPSRRRAANAPSLLALLLTVSTLLAGCGDPAPGPATRDDLPALSWPALNVETTHLEPEPQRGDLLVTWQGGRFGISAPGEGDLPSRSVVDGGVVYFTDLGIGWQRADRDGGVADGRLSNRFHLWDLKGLAEDPGLARTVTATEDGHRIEGAGTLRRGTYEIAVTYSVLERAGRVVSGVVASDAGRESPFTFRPAGTPFPFALDVPATSKEGHEVQAGDQQAAEAHAFLFGLVTQYQRNRGSLPDSVDPQTLGLELLASGRAWPTNPYTGEDVGTARRSGDLAWLKCSPQDGRYQGFGWDGPVLLRPLGSSCV